MGKHLCYLDLKFWDCFITRWLYITCILVIIWGKFRKRVLTLLSQKRKTFSEIFLAFWQSTKKFVHFEKKDQLHSLNTSKVIDSEKCGYLNARKLFFPDTLQESTCSRVANTVQITMAAFLCYISINPRYIALEKISLSEMKNLRTVW